MWSSQVYLYHPVQGQSTISFFSKEGYNTWPKQFCSNPSMLKLNQTAEIEYTTASEVTAKA